MPNHMMYKSNEQGKCPYCNSLELEYGAAEFQDDGMVFYPWTCEHCGRTGEEWYNMTFVGHNDDEGNIIELKGE